MSDYIRVIPRDLFNEGNLLKCYARVVICLENVPNCRARFLESDVTEFDVVQDQNSGAIYIDNLPLAVGREPYKLTRPLNSRGSWPLYVEHMDPGAPFDPIAVFDDAGNFTDEMLAFITPKS